MVQKLLSFIFFLLIFVVPVLGQQDNVSQKNYQNIYAVTVDGVITGSTASIIDSAKNIALENRGILLIKLNTPGGVLDATRNIVQSIMSDTVPVAVYVTPSGARAASAGIFITLAADFAVMDKGTNIGAAHPVNPDGKDIEGEMGKKVTNDTVAFIRSIAETRGRNVTDAEKMVLDSASFTAEEALKLGLIDAIVTPEKTIQKLLVEKFNIPDTAKIEYINPTFTQKIFGFLSNPNILAGLLLLGMGCLALEFKMPGTFVFAGLGSVFLILFGIGSSVIPINYLAMLLIFGGIALLVADFFVTSFGLLSASGIAALYFGMRMLFDRGDNMNIDISLWLIITILVFFAVVALLIGKLIVKDFRRRPVTGMENMINKKAVVIEWVGNKGKVAIYGEIWNAESQDPLDEKDEVTIIGYDGMVVTVKKVNA